jgi:hypothetical protein
VEAQSIQTLIKLATVFIILHYDQYVVNRIVTSSWKLLSLIEPYEKLKRKTNRHAGIYHYSMLADGFTSTSSLFSETPTGLLLTSECERMELNYKNRESVDIYK